MPETGGIKTLLVRHLPAELSPEEQRILLEKSGAASVRLCSGRTRGSLKNAAFVTYPNEFAAAKALSILHQLNILGQTLVAEYAKENLVHLPDQPSFSEKKSKDKGKGEQDVKPPNQVSIERGIAPNHGLVFPIKSSLKYLYPPPTSTILANIANALASVPKFYVQVLHLMNKLNLPAPFGHLTRQPPLYADYVVLPTLYPPVPPDLPENPPLPELDDDYDMEVSSREESEYESDDDNDEKERVARIKELANLLPKRPKTAKQPRPRKKMKIKDLVTPALPHNNAHIPLQPSDVFEKPCILGPKKLELHIPSDIPVAKEELYKATENGESLQGFGKIYPAPATKDEEEEEEEDDEDYVPKDFISKRELAKGRVSKEEMRKNSVFKNYDPGEPNCRLYVKNLAKQADEKDLKFIFGRFIDFSNETEKNMFDIRLMKEGRMKGQAFLGFPSEKIAAHALKHVNGYTLHDKPMVIVFARSARPKTNAAEIRKKH